MNSVAETQSDTTPALLASVPSQPSPPTSASDGTFITIAMSPQISDGGSQITSYKLQVRYSAHEGWVTELGGPFRVNLGLSFSVQRDLG